MTKCPGADLYQLAFGTGYPENLFDLTDYPLYKNGLLELFGFGIEEIDYEAVVNPAA